MGVRVCADKTHYSVAGFFVGMGGELRFIAGAAVYAAVVFKEFIHHLLDLFEGWGGSGIVEINIGGFIPIEERDLDIQAEVQGCIVLRQDVSSV